MIIIKEWMQSQKTYFVLLLCFFLFISSLYFGIFHGVKTSATFKTSTPLPQYPADALIMSVVAALIIMLLGIFILPRRLVLDEFTKETFPFLLIKPVSRLKFFSIKYILGFLQALSFLLMPLICLLIMPIDISTILTAFKADDSIIKILSILFGIYSFLFCFYLYFEEKSSRALLWLIPIYLTISAIIKMFPRVIASVGTSNLTGITFGGWVLAGLISNIFSFLILQYPKIKIPTRKIFNFIGVFCAMFIFVFVALRLSRHPYGLFTSSSTVSILFPPLFRLLSYTFVPRFQAAGSQIIQQIILGLLAGAACASYIFWNSRRRVNKKIYSRLWALCGFLFTFIGLICYLSLRNKGAFKECPSCGREKLSYIYPCQYCGYHFDKEFKREPRGFIAAN